MGVERGHQHQGFIQQLTDALPVRLYPRRAVFVKTFHPVCQQTHRLQEVMDNHRAIDVKLKVARCPAKIHRHVVANNLAAQHGHGFALRWIHFSRHDRTARLVFRNTDFPDTTAWAGRQPAHVVGDFH
ncbi:hypothetical protein D3C76_1123150 [compost metagenome]